MRCKICFLDCNIKRCCLDNMRHDFMNFLHPHFVVLSSPSFTFLSEKQRSLKKASISAMSTWFFSRQAFPRTDTDHHVCGSPDFIRTSIFDMSRRVSTHINFFQWQDLQKSLHMLFLLFELQSFHLQTVVM